VGHGFRLAAGLPRGVLLVFLLAPLLAGQPLVNLNVIAVDRQGQPVPNLRAEDFQILDNGKPRDIAWFRPVSRKGLKAPATFILLDLFNADLAARGLSVNEITRALERLESADNVYLHLLTSTAKIFAIHAVTPPGAQPEAGDGPWTRRIKPMMDQALRQVNALKSQDDRLAWLRIEPTWKALSELTSQMAQVPGPKSFVWITQGVENGYIEVGRQVHLDTAPLRNFAAGLNALETAAYAVEQRPSGSLPPQNEGSPGDTLAQVSALTGGRVFPTDTTTQAIKAAASDALRVNYRIAFLPDRLDGKYHKIRVTTTRKDIKIQTTQNYYAIAEPDREQKEEALVDAIGASPFDYPEIGLAVTNAPGPSTPGILSFAIKVDAADVLFLKEGARYKASLAIAVVESDSSGRKTLVDDGMPLDLDLSAEEYANAMTDGIAITRRAKVDETVRQRRLVVMDRNSNLAGTLTVK